MEVIKDSFKVSVILPTKDFSGWEYNTPNDITVHTELNLSKKDFIFKCTIPKFVFDGVKDREEKYYTNPPKKNFGKAKKFNQNLSSVTLVDLLSQLANICTDAVSYKQKDEEKTEKFIAIKFSHEYNESKDSLNFASMGMITSSKFQYFTVYKVVGSKSITGTGFKSKKCVYNSQSSVRWENFKRPWYYYGTDIKKEFQLVKWSQEREDFLKRVEDKFVNLNNSLHTFLGEIDDDKIELLMQNNNLLLE